jgi:hypothetical protein
MKEHTWQDTIDEIKALEEANKPYYRLFVDRDEKPIIVCLQPFDECGYDQSRFINKRQYETEVAAEKALFALMVRASVPLSIEDRLKLAAMLEEEQ